MDSQQIAQLLQALADLPVLVKRFGKDGQQLEAFVEDAKKAVAAAKTDEERAALFGSLTLVVLLALRGVRDFKWFNPGSYDMFKPMRLKCDEVAKIANFVEYKKLRNL